MEYGIIYLYTTLWEVRNMNILLFGVSNVGKSVSGRLLADLLGYSFYDLDDEVKKTKILPLRNLFLQEPL